MKPTDLKDEQEAFRLERNATLKRRLTRAKALVAQATASGKDASDIRREIAEYRKALAESESQPRRSKRIPPKQ